MTIEFKPILQKETSNSIANQAIFTAGGELLTESVFLPNYPDKTIGSCGTTLNGKIATVQGSFDETTWYTMKDMDGTNAIFNGIGQEFLLKGNPLYLRISLNDSTGVDFSIILSSADKE